MQTRQVEVVLPEDTFLRLEAAAKAAGQPVQETAAAVLCRAFPSTPKVAEPAAMPGVALVRNGFTPLLQASQPEPLNSSAVSATSINSLTRPEGPATAGMFTPGRPTIAVPPSPEKMQRRLEIEAKMKELSLLIETAEETKKEDYLLQYAMLAAEIESLV